MKVLIADDSAVLRLALSRLLERSGYEVVVAADGLEAIQAFYTENPDLVLLDVGMPKLHGYVVCRLLKEDPAAAHVPVLILTARDSAEDRYWGQRSGADGFLTKEMVGDELLDAIQSALASRALTDLSLPAPVSRSVDASDVLTRVCEVLDRKLFEATIVNDIVAVGVRGMDLHGTVAEALSILHRLVSFDVAALAMPADQRMVIRFQKPCSPADFDEFRSLCSLRSRQYSATELVASDLSVLSPPGTRFEEFIDYSQMDRGWGEFAAAPLWSRGEVVAVLAFGAHRAGGLGEGFERNLRMIEHHLATVVDSARYHQRVLEQEARNSLSSLFD